MPRTDGVEPAQRRTDGITSRRRRPIVRAATPRSRRPHVQTTTGTITGRRPRARRQARLAAIAISARSHSGSPRSSSLARASTARAARPTSPASASSSAATPRGDDVHLVAPHEDDHDALLGEVAPLAHDLGLHGLRAAVEVDRRRRPRRSARRSRRRARASGGRRCRAGARGRAPRPRPARSRAAAASIRRSPCTGMTARGRTSRIHSAISSRWACPETWIGGSVSRTTRAPRRTRWSLIRLTERSWPGIVRAERSTRSPSASSRSACSPRARR